MLLKKQYRIYCVTEDVLVYGYTILEDPPTECPNNAAHTVDATTKAVTAVYELDNLEATTDPTTHDDVWDGYAVGSRWINVEAERAFVCLHNEANAAIWQRAATTGFKSGMIIPAQFTGNPKTAAVVFATAFPDANYSVVIGGADVRNWSVDSQTNTGFVINTNAGKNPSSNVMWEATKHGEL